VRFWGGAGFQDVGDVDIFPAEAHGSDHLIEFLPRRPNKWPTELVLHCTGRFANKHQPSRWRALAKDKIGVTSGLCAMTTFSGVGQLKFRQRKNGICSLPRFGVV
jgi:hypothetical protein